MERILPIDDYRHSAEPSQVYPVPTAIVRTSLLLGQV